MKMFVNVARITTAPEDRIVVVVGGGHLPLLTHFAEASGRYELEPVRAYLD